MSQVCRIDPVLVRRLQVMLKQEGAVVVPSLDAQRLLWRSPQLVAALGDEQLAVERMRFILLDSWGKFLLGAAAEWPLSNATPQEAAEFWGRYLAAVRAAGYSLIGVED